MLEAKDGQVLLEGYAMEKIVTEADAVDMQEAAKMLVDAGQDEIAEIVKEKYVAGNWILQTAQLTPKECEKRIPENANRDEYRIRPARFLMDKATHYLASRDKVEFLD